MANKDFFDKEFEKLEKSQNSMAENNTRVEQRTNNGENVDDYLSRGNGDFNSWSGYQPQQEQQVKSRKPLYISLICVALVLCIALGWVLCAVFGGLGSTSRQEDLFRDVMDILANDYYEKISDEQMWDAIEAAGTALLQTGGDQFSRLMSPKTYYNYLHSVTEVVSNGAEVFGMSFQFVSGVGMYVTDVVANSAAYGKLNPYDIIVKITNINRGAGVSVRFVDDSVVNYTELVISNCSESLTKAVLQNTNSATFHVLRDGEITQYDMTRGIVSYVNLNYQFDFVEFYFGDKLTNVSVKPQGTSGLSTKTERSLDKLPANTGYIRLAEFAGDNDDPQAYEEFKSALELFNSSNLKHLVLDLKGNPGGNVYIAQKIAGLLVTDAKLSSQEKAIVTGRNNELLITTLKLRSGAQQQYREASHYNEYFQPIGDKCDIVVWTDGGSASASELLTGALLDYKTAIQMGVTTYGKGIAQTVMPLTEYSGTFLVNGIPVTENWCIYFTIAKYYTPLDHNIHGVGYTPDEQYDGLDTYDKLWQATSDYFASTGIGGGIAA